MTLHGALPLATVKGTPVFRNAAPFAGRCWNEGLGRSDTLPSGLFPWGGRADDSGCPLDRRGGERAFVREQSVRTRRGRHRPSRRRKDTSFTRSRDLALSLAGSPSSQGERDDATPQGGAQRASDRIDSGQTCSAGGTGGGARRGGRKPARRASPTISREVARVPRQNRDGGRGLLLVREDSKSSSRSVPVRRSSLQKSSGGVLVSNKPLLRASKKRRGGSERGPSSVRSSAVPRGAVGGRIE